MSQANTTIIEGLPIEAMRKFLSLLIQNRHVSSVLALRALHHGSGFVYALVSDPDGVSHINPFVPIMPVNAARIISDITRLAPLDEKIAVVLRPCELRGLVELVKLKQAHLENLLLIGVDCLGTYGVKTYQKEEYDDRTVETFLIMSKGAVTPGELRMACAICEHFVPHVCDVNVGLFGVDIARHLLMIARSDAGRSALVAVGLWEPVEVTALREKEVEEKRARNKHLRKTYFEQAASEVGGMEKMLGFFSSCIGCHNCREVCPLCYCKECFFDSPVFELEARKYVDWARRKGAIRLPKDTMLFHLTRLNHMVSSCVSCGACAEACPNSIELTKIFPRVADEVQAMFGYVAGRDLEEQLPLATFREDELSTLGTG